MPNKIHNFEDINHRYKIILDRKKTAEEELKYKNNSLLITSRKLNNHIEARTFYIELSKTIQKQTKEYIEKIVTMAIRTIFGRPYTFHLIYEEKRNNITCTPLIKLGDKEYIPKDDKGGAMLDIIGLIMKIVLWSVNSPRSRNTFFFDEPFRFCGGLTLKAAQVFKKLGRKLNFQMIIITHSKQLVKICDRVFEVKKFNGISQVKRKRRLL